MRASLLALLLTLGLQAQPAVDRPCPEPISTRTSATHIRIFDAASGEPMSGMLMLREPPPNFDPRMIPQEVLETYLKYFSDFKADCEFLVASGRTVSTIRGEQDRLFAFFFWEQAGQRFVTWWQIHFDANDVGIRRQDVYVFTQQKLWTDAPGSPYAHRGGYFKEIEEQASVVIQPPADLPMSAIPLVLVHGINGSPGYWNDIPRKLLSSYRVWEIYYGLGQQPAGDSAELVSHALRQIRERSGATRLDVVTHSYGGVVVRYMLHKNSDEASRIRRLLMIGPPHHGSEQSAQVYKAARGLSGEILPAVQRMGLTEDEYLDPFAPIYLDLSPGSAPLSEMAREVKRAFSGFDGRPDDVLVIAGRSLPGPQNWFGYDEAPGHQDGLVSVSSASLLGAGVPLAIVEASHSAQTGCEDDPEPQCSRTLEMIREFLEGGAEAVIRTGLDALPEHLQRAGLVIEGTEFGTALTSVEMLAPHEALFRRSLNVGTFYYYGPDDQGLAIRFNPSNEAERAVKLRYKFSDGSVDTEEFRIPLLQTTHRLLRRLRYAGPAVAEVQAGQTVTIEVSVTNASPLPLENVWLGMDIVDSKNNTVEETKTQARPRALLDFAGQGGPMGPWSTRTFSAKYTFLTSSKDHRYAAGQYTFAFKLWQNGYPGEQGASEAGTLQRQGFIISNSQPAAGAPPRLQLLQPRTTGPLSRSLLRFSITDADGRDDLASVEVRVATSAGAADACAIRYSHSSGTVALLGDNGITWSSDAKPGSDQMLENQRCRLFVIRSWAVAASQEVLLTLDIGAKAPLAGNMRIFAQAVDRAGRVASFADFGGWTVQSPPASNSAPAGLYLRPALSNYGFSATIRFEFADPNGAHDIAWVLPVINSSLRGANSCSFEFDRSTNLLWLRNDGDTGWLGPVVAGNAGTIANSQCTIDAGQIRIETEDITLRIFVPVTFATAFRGDKTVYLRAEDASGAGRGWEARGFWFVQ